LTPSTALYFCFESYFLQKTGVQFSEKCSNFSIIYFLPFQKLDQRLRDGSLLLSLTYQNNIESEEHAHVQLFYKHPPPVTSDILSRKPASIFARIALKWCFDV